MRHAVGFIYGNWWKAHQDVSRKKHVNMCLGRKEQGAGNTFDCLMVYFIYVELKINHTTYCYKTP